MPDQTGLSRRKHQQNPDTVQSRLAGVLREKVLIRQAAGEWLGCYPFLL
jgi:hypothetical protein